MKVLSLFSGCGGMDLGMIGGFSYLGKKYEKLPFEIVYSIDFDANCSKIYKSRFYLELVNFIDGFNEWEIKTFVKEDVLIEEPKEEPREELQEPKEEIREEIKENE